MKLRYKIADILYNYSPYRKIRLELADKIIKLNKKGKK